MIGLALVVIAASPAAANASASWSAVPSMSSARFGHNATLLDNGLILVTGGSPFAAAGAELYDPVTNRWLSTSSMVTALSADTATLLTNGRVLVTGGASAPATTSSVEIYDPATNSWSAAASMPTASSGHTATLLANGKVLVAGGFDGTAQTAAAELYDPSTDSWSAAADMPAPRDGDTATLVNTGQVLIVGGTILTGAIRSVTQTAELYDPASNTWSPAASMAQTRVGHAATLLGSGSILVTGGRPITGATASSTAQASAELYDPASNTWSPVPSMAVPREGHTATLLSSGDVLVTGGTTAVGTTRPTSTAELYDPNTNSWSSQPSMASPRNYHTATRLSDGRVLVTGGRDASGDLASAEVYAPDAPPPATPPVNAAPTRVSGPPMVGDPLSCLPGTWTGTLPMTFTYGWLRGGTPLATGVTYTPRSNDVGTLIACEQTAGNSVGSAQATSASVLVKPQPSRFVRILATGHATPPAGVTRRAACHGVVHAVVLKGKEVLAHHRTRLNSHCRWRWTARVRRTAIGNATRLRLRWRFGGNDFLLAATLSRGLEVPGT